MHVIPLADLIEHDETDTCICGPTTEPVERGDGTVGWLISHRWADDDEDE